MRPRAAPAVRFMLALAALTAAAAAARAEDVPPVLSPLRVEADANGVNLVDGRTTIDGPVLAVPGAPNLRFDRIQNAAPYVSGHVLTPSGSESDDRTYSVHTGTGTSESFRCQHYQCASVTGTGSTFVWNTRTYQQAGTGAVWTFGYRQVETPSPNRWLAYYAGSVRYPNGEEISYVYDRVPAPGDAFGRMLHRPTRIASNLGFSIAISYRSDDVAADGWAQVREAAIYNDSDPAAPVLLGRLTYGSDGTIRDLGGRVYACEGCATLLGADIEVGAGSLRLPGEAAPARRVAALANAPVVGSVERDGLAWSYAYDHLQQQQASVGYLYDGLSVTGPDGDRTRYEFVAMGPSSARRNVITRVTDPLGRATAYAHDFYYRLLSVTYPEGNAVSVAYDAYGNIVARTATPRPNMGQAITESAFYPIAACAGVLCSRPSWTRDGLGRQTDYSYNDRGQLTEQLDPADPAGVRRRTSIAYATAAGLSRRSAVRICADAGTSCAANAPIQTEYDYWGTTFLPLVERRIDGSGGTPATLETRYGYDAAGRLVSTDGPLPGSDDMTWNRYDAYGRRTWEIGARAADGVRIARRFTYRDSDDRPVAVETGTLPDETSTALTNIRRTDIAYDLRRNPIRETVSAGGAVFAVTDKSWDLSGRLICTAVRMNLAVLPPLATLDACAPGQPGGQGPDRITRNEYDAAGQRLQLREGVGTSDEGTEASWAYNANGQVTAVIDGNGNRAELSYDGHGRQVRWTFPSATRPAAFDDTGQATALATAGAANPADYEAYTYDDVGNRLTLRKRDGSVLSYQYDDLNRMTRKTVPERAGLDPAHTRDVFYGYDLRNLQLYARFDSPTGEGVTNSFDGFGRLASSSIDIAGVTRTLSYAYDPAGNRTRITHPDGRHFDYRYDALGRFTRLRENDDSDVVSLSYRPTGERYILNRGGAATGYVYDDIGRLSYLVNDLPGSARVSWTFARRNPAGQIVTVLRDNDAYAWTRHYAVARSYVTNGLNQYVATASPLGNAAYGYDANGNLTSDGSRTFSYDVENRLVGASGAVTLVYDPLGRLFQTGGGSSDVINYLYDGDALVAEYGASSGVLLRRYVHGSGVDEPLLRYDGNTVSWENRHQLFADAQGSIVAIANASGQDVSINAYDEYGIPAATNSGRFQYTGQIWLPELGMYHYKARAYSPALGRFMQTDPVGYDGGINLYAYVGDDPVNLADPGGTWPAAIGGGILFCISNPTCRGLAIRALAAVSLTLLLPPGQNPAPLPTSPVLNEQNSNPPAGEQRRPPPNRHGSEGAPDHRADVRGPGRRQAEAQAQPGEEVLTERPVRGHPGVRRRPDNQIVGRDNRTRLVVESERRPTGRYHRDRENDYRNCGIECQTRRLPPTSGD